MPILTVHLPQQPTPGQQDALAQAVAQDLLRLTTELLHKRADLTAVLLQFTAPHHWFVGGQSLAQLGQPAAFVEIRVTDDTNTAAEKSAWIAAVHQALGHHLPGLHEVSYQQVQDLRPAAWGYGGQTQEARRHRAVEV